jgi:hypothetical protein
MTKSYKWTKRRELAAQLVADDSLNDEQIAARVGISGKQLDRWKKIPEFSARVDGHLALWREQIRRDGLAVKERRIQSLIADFNATTRILNERGHDLAMLDEQGNQRREGAPGGATGFITRDFKSTRDALIPVFAFDAALMKERRELRKQIATELGDWADRHEFSGRDRGPIITETKSDLSGVPTDILIKVIELLTPPNFKEDKDHATT